MKEIALGTFLGSLFSFVVFGILLCTVHLFTQGKSKKYWIFGVSFFVRMSVLFVLFYYTAHQSIGCLMAAFVASLFVRLLFLWKVRSV